MTENITWTRPESPPPALFFGKKERDYVKQVSDEVTECVIGQAIVYYPVSEKHSQFHELYGEAIEKTFLPPVRIFARVFWNEGAQTKTEKYNIDNESRITVKIHTRRLNEDYGVFMREGDFIFYGDRFYEIHKVNKPRELFGQADYRFETSIECLRAREGQFAGAAAAQQARELLRETPTQE